MESKIRPLHQRGDDMYLVKELISRLLDVKMSMPEFEEKSGDDLSSPYLVWWHIPSLRSFYNDFSLFFELFYLFTYRGPQPLQEASCFDVFKSKNLIS